MDINYEFLLDLDYKFNYSIKNLNIKKKGIQGTLDLSKFTRLVKLDCSWNEITQIINIPKSLKKLECHSNLITSMDNLPSNLENLSCSYNNITSLDNLPTSLKYLECNCKFIDSLDYLPSGLIKLICCYTKIKNLNCLPNSLVSINIQGNLELKSIILPPGLETIIIDNCKFINKLDNIPKTLTFLCCPSYQLDNLNEIKKKFPHLKIKNKND